MNLYCIQHEEMVRVQKGNPSEIIHEVYSFYESGHIKDLDFCEFPDGWAASPPPESLFDQIFDSADEESDALEFLGVWKTWCKQNEPGTDDLDNPIPEPVF